MKTSVDIDGFNLDSGCLKRTRMSGPTWTPTAGRRFRRHAISSTASAMSRPTSDARGATHLHPRSGRWVPGSSAD